MTDTVVTTALAREMLDDSAGIYRDYEEHHKPTVRGCRIISVFILRFCRSFRLSLVVPSPNILLKIWLMKVGGFLSMTASNFIMRDVLIRYNKGERIRLTHLVVFQVCNE
jgi:hypothetical protein